MAVLGDREVADGTVALRTRAGSRETLSRQAFIGRVQDRIATRSQEPRRPISRPPSPACRMTSFWSRPASWLTSITRSRSSAQKALVDQAVGKSTRQAMQMLAEVDPALAVPADRVRALGEGRWELKVAIFGSATGYAADTSIRAPDAAVRHAICCRSITYFPYDLGGVAEPRNVRLLCFAHHRHRHGDLGSSRKRPN